MDSLCVDTVRKHTLSVFQEQPMSYEHTIIRPNKANDVDRRFTIVEDQKKQRWQDYGTVTRRCRKEGLKGVTPSGNARRRQQADTTKSC